MSHCDSRPEQTSNWFSTLTLTSMLSIVVRECGRLCSYGLNTDDQVSACKYYQRLVLR